MSKINSFNVTYDRDSDVLYISSRKVAAARGIEDEYGIVWRYDRDGELIGATIVAFYDQWFTKRLQLAEKLSEQFHIPAPQAKIVVDHAFESRVD